MSNDKTMRLYTEEQVTELLKEIFKDDFLKGSDIIPIILGKELTPIELPSDEEIEKASFTEKYQVAFNPFASGAKWLIDKIQGGNK